MIFRKRERARVLRPFQINPWSPGYHIVLQCTSGSKQSETIGADWVIEKGSIRVGIPRSYRCPWDRRSAGRSSRPPRLPRCRRNIGGYGVMAVQGITAAEKPPARVISTSVAIASTSPRKAIAASLPSRRPPRVTGSVCTAPRTSYWTHPNMSICGSTPAAACILTSPEATPFA